MSLHYNGDNSYLFVNRNELCRFKANNGNVNFLSQFCLGSISNKFSNTEAEELSLKENVYDFSVDYKSIAVNDILDIHKYLMKKKRYHIKRFGFVKQIFVSIMMFLGCILSKVNSLKCVSINNQECKVRPEIININSNESSFYPYSVKISKCSGSCDNINDPYANLCVPDVSKNMNVKVFNLISRTDKDT